MTLSSLIGFDQIDAILSEHHLVSLVISLPHRSDRSSRFLLLVIAIWVIEVP